MNAPSPERLKALLQLLSDPDENIARTIQAELVRMGPPVLPFLETARAEHPSLAPLLGWVVEEIHFPQILESFRQGLLQSSLDWEQGAFLIAQLRDPALNIAHYRSILDELAEEFRTKWDHGSPSTEDAAQRLAMFLFKDKGFSGNQEHYYDPDNSFIHVVIDRRQGIPITLSALYVFVGKRVGLPVVGVGLPGHFIVRIEEVTPPLFLDTFNGGARLKEQDCRQFIEAAGLEFYPHYLDASPAPAILSRMLRNLLGIYEETQQETMVRRVKALLTSFES